VYAIFTSKGNDDMSKDKISVGLFGIGLDTYWPQFEGLKERLEGYQEDIAREIPEKRCRQSGERRPGR
jgi:hypothetical protein